MDSLGGSGLSFIIFLARLAGLRSSRAALLPSLSPHSAINHN